MKVLVEIRGGVAHLVRKPKGIEVTIKDYDTDGSDTDVFIEKYGKEEKL